MFTYKTHGTCSTSMDLEIEDGIITHCKIHQGCKGNTQGLAAMVIGRNADEVANLLEGIQCRGGTSCPDQLSKAIRACQAERSAS
ncbi:MAG: TIGR03905 family TSCPD domain-containing protein [Clostridia bacterium]|nr:TIGR03905 family TSCPD domain-containing protein [Clostridia bacterium]